MRKATGLERQDTAVGFYRIIQPMRFLKREGLVEESRILPFTGGMETQKFQFTDKVLMKTVEGTDIILTDMIWRDDDFLQILNLRKWSGAKWIIDIDDNMLAVTRDNPAFAGVKEVLPNMERSMQFADGLTVSVPLLKLIYSPLNKNIFVNPNGIDFSWWDSFRPKRHQGLRIGWRGASGHKYDLELVVPAMRQITKDYPGTKFIVFHQFDPKFDFPYEWQPFVSFFGKEDPNNPKKHDPDYPEVLARLGLDIALVPLVDTPYNRCKSNLAYLEFSALGIPCVMSPVENQKNMVARYAQTNFEWYEQISLLIENYDIRKLQGVSAYDFVKDKYNMKNLIKPFYDWADSLPRRTDVEPSLV